MKKADAVISLCKMKTHALENITGAVKNQYGCIYGSYKAAGHAMYPNSRIFADMLCDLNRCVAPRLYLMDGIIAMEGNGPASGTPKSMKVLLLSSDPVALDSVFAKLVFLDAHHVPTCVSGAKNGLGRMEYSEITILTPDGEISAEEAAEKYGDPGFEVHRKNATFWRVRSLLPAARKYSDRPAVDPDLCIGCGICQQACPVDGQAVHSGHGQKAVYNYKKCIRCYCCQELCPFDAVKFKKPIVYRIARKLKKNGSENRLIFGAVSSDPFKMRKAAGFTFPLSSFCEGSRYRAAAHNTQPAAQA